ncbi:hypothetical protein ACIA8G_39925 [Lentzea sp. NPDC051213]|uniref:hypothetical protein n=1 Tax=Lentzea sp. NPDC051213 TaxID=3364126 RepID=UPI00378AFA82
MKPTIAVLLAVLMALTACGAKEQKSDGNKDSTGDMVKFAQCMRENGIDMPDPEGDGGGVRMEAMPADGDTEKMDAAHNACKQHLPNGGEFKPPSPEEQDKMRQQAKCMRDKGHNWPDPTFDGSGGDGEGMTVELGDEKVEKDMKDCGFQMEVSSSAEGK